MQDTWWSRDLPVLDAVVRLLDEGNFMVRVADIAGDTGLDTGTVDRAIDALTGQYVREYNKSMTGGIPDTWYVTEVTAAARRAVGQWPTAESLTEQLATAFSEAAEGEPDPERKGPLRQIASIFTGAGKEVVTDVLAKVILHQTGMG
jgi:hypothetical protein